MKDEKELRTYSRRDARALAFHLVYAVDRADYAITLQDAIETFIRGYHLDIPDESFAVTLAQGAIDSRDELDEKIKPLLKNWKLERLGVCTKLILRLALWELGQADAIPSIIINEAVELAKAFAEKDAYKFVNGVLDRISKEKQPK